MKQFFSKIAVLALAGAIFDGAVASGGASLGRTADVETGLLYADPYVKDRGLVNHDITERPNSNLRFGRRIDLSFTYFPDDDGTELFLKYRKSVSIIDRVESVGPSNVTLLEAYAREMRFLDSDREPGAYVIGLKVLDSAGKERRGYASIVRVPKSPTGLGFRFLKNTYALKSLELGARSQWHTMKPIRNEWK